LKTLLNVIPIERVCWPKVECVRTAAPVAAVRAAGERGASLHVTIIVLLLTSFATAQTLTGTVRNSTTGKPSAGDEVVVFKLGQGMEESGHTKTDASGQFRFKVDDPKATHLVRAIHQDVTYHRLARPGTTAVALEVYDVARKVTGIRVFADIMRIRAAQGQIAVTREFAVQNTSNPPRTQMNAPNLEFYVPDNAHIIDGSATATIENGNPLKSAPVPEGERNRYSFIFPLRPGLTRFEVTYQLPYSGSASIDPKSIYPLEHFVVMLPKALQFKAAASSTHFKLMNIPNEPDATVQVASNTTHGQNLAFTISGERSLETGQRNATQGPGEGQRSSAGIAQSNNRPGGGLGTPIDAPDPLQEYRWWILGGAAAVLSIGGLYVASRQQSTVGAFRRQKSSSSLRTTMQQRDEYEPAEAGGLDTTRAHAARHTLTLMEGIKEKIFQIEVERKQGQISRAEYEKAKAALDQTLSRALKREAPQA